MATPKCPKCDNTTFEFNDVKPANTDHIYKVLTCSKCGCAIGLIENINVANVLLQIAEFLKIKIR